MKGRRKKGTGTEASVVMALVVYMMGWIGWPYYCTTYHGTHIYRITH